VAAPAIEAASLFRHEPALDATFDRLTNHGDHLFPYPVVFVLKKPTRLRNRRSQVGHFLKENVIK
jgi:hypothetical protein